ncbi:MAG: hypothetical protein N3I35_18970 [Clostridia bacterium]|nr:hypothetical protein [Clostridia bacterium]
MKKRIIAIFAIITVLLVTLTGCVPGDGTNTPEKQAGFFWGIWHGWIAPVSLIIGFFKKNIRIYEVMNSGWWYDFGFYIAIISGFGGVSLGRKKRSKKNDK